VRSSFRICFLAAIVVIIGLLSGLAKRSNGAVQKPAAPRWEYNLVSVDSTDASVRRLNEEGNSGWELVGIQTISGNTRYLFKRPLN
jgi:hypothetical protein